MKNKLKILCAATVLLALLPGCRTVPFKHSSLAETLTSDKLVHKVVSSAGTKVVEDSLQDGGTHGRNIEFRRNFEVALGSARAGKMIGDYRAEALKQIFAAGGVIHGSSQVTPGDGDLRDFHYRYHWAKNEGLIR